MSFSRTLIASIVDLLGGLITTLLILRISYPYELGIYSRLLSIGLLASGLATLGIDLVIRYYVPKGHDPSSFIGLATISIASAALLLSFLSPPAAILSFFSGLYLLHISLSLARRDYRSYLLIVLSRRSLQPILVPLAFYFYGPTAAIYVLSLTFAPSLIVLKEAALRVPEGLKDILASFLTRGLTTLSIYFDKLLIAMLYGYHTLGAFYFVRQISMLAAIPIAAFDRYSVQEVASGRSVRREIALSGLLALILAISAYEFSRVVSRAFPNYSPYVHLLRAPIAFVLARAWSAYEKALALGAGRFDLNLYAQAVALIATLSVVILSGGSLELLVLSPAIGQIGYAITIKITRS